SAIIVDAPNSAPLAGQNTLQGTHAGQTNNGWYAINNAWNSASLKYGTDYTNSVSYTYKDLSKGTTFNWDFPKLTLAEGTAGNVLAYPDLLFGASPFSGGTNPGDKAQVFPVQLSKLTSLKADFDVGYSGDTSGFNVAFDIWLTNKPGGDASTVTNEIMVWLHKGDFEAFGDKIGTYQDGDFAGTIYRAPGTHYTAIVANSDTPVGTLDMVKLFDTLIDMGIVGKDEYLAMSQLGAEVVSGSGTLTINHLNYDVQTKEADGTLKIQHVTGTGTTTEIVKPVTTIDGTDGADNLVATASQSVLHALDGDDMLTAVSGTNTLHGGKGNDTYVLHSINDTVIELSGEGNDTVKAGFSYTLTDHVENLALTGTEAINGTGNALNNFLYGNSASNRLDGGAGDDMLDGGAGADILVGGAGFDFAVYASARSGVVANLWQTQSGGDAAGDTFSSIEGLIGSSFADRLTGDNSDNIIKGGAGDDFLDGSGGNDVIIGGAGKDTLVGGYRSDTFVFGSGDGRDTIADLHFMGARDTLKLNTNLGVSSYADVLSHAVEKAGTTYITFDTGDSLVLYQKTMASLAASDFLFFT
ncbi:MAG: hypothetical protein QHC90_30955, partial [Shinella sp.]|nr:hypothetical protein [Shinella sp.]